jgi:List-Bact-rpt repeat protein
MTSDNGQLIRLAANAAPGSVFRGWTGSCTGATCTPTLTSDMTVTAVFGAAAPTQYQLSISKAGDGSGTVASSTGGIACGATCAATLPAGTVVGLTAAADKGSTFGGWSGACSGTDPCSLVLGAAAAVTATFAKVKDTAAPRVVAFAASAKRGKKAKLSYFVSDDSGQSSEQITVFKGRKVLAKLVAAVHVAKAGTVHNVAWKIPGKLAPGKRRYCVTATDASGNKSAPSCAPLTIKR